MKIVMAGRKVKQKTRCEAGLLFIRAIRGALAHSCYFYRSLALGNMPKLYVNRFLTSQ